MPILKTPTTPTGARSAGTSRKGFSMRRRKMSKKRSKRSFRNGAKRISSKNNTPRPMRGGYRL